MLEKKAIQQNHTGEDALIFRCSGRIQKPGLGVNLGANAQNSLTHGLRANLSFSLGLNDIIYLYYEFGNKIPIRL